MMSSVMVVPIAMVECPWRVRREDAVRRDAAAPAGRQAFILSLPAALPNIARGLSAPKGRSLAEPSPALGQDRARPGASVAGICSMIPAGATDERGGFPRRSPASERGIENVPEDE
jgi:hypothetical protein